MFTLDEKFDLLGDGGMPYSMTEENLHSYANASGKVESGKLLLLRRYAKMILKTPKLQVFDFSCKLGFSPLASSEGIPVVWGIHFGYDPERRAGKLLHVKYSENDRLLSFELYKQSGIDKVLLFTQSTEHVELSGNTMYDLNFSVQSGKCIGCFNGVNFGFDCGAVDGKIALVHILSIHGVLFSDIHIESNCAPYEIIRDENYVMPHYDGGSEDYALHLTVKKYTCGTYEVSYELTGGAGSKYTQDYKMGVWSIQYDIITNAYIRFYGAKNTDKLYLKNGELRFVEQNEKIKKPELYLQGHKMPYTGSFFLEEFDESAKFAYGYELFRSLGTDLQQGRREFVYAQNTLVYSGAPLTDDCIITVQSPEDKKMTEKIPKDIDLYAHALFHAQKNHYFMHDEDAVFKIETHIQKYAELTTAKFYLLDAFYDVICELHPSQEKTDTLAEYGFVSRGYNINLGKKAQGVYHIQCKVLLGEQVLQVHTSAFEVLDDTALSPRESSGFPFMYSGEAAPIKVEYNCPDPWMIKPDHNEVHYVDCMQAVPEITEHRAGWALLKTYKRKMFLWANSRSIPKGKTFKDYPKSLKLADFVCIDVPERAPLTYCNVLPYIFTSEAVRKIYNQFKEAHPDYVLFDMPEDGKVSKEDFIDLFKRYGTAWLAYLNDKNTDNLMELYDEVRAEYPKLKFSHYGPYNLYTMKHSGIRRTNMSFKPYKRAAEMMDGFWIFEDYPFVTGQATYNSSWAMMGLLQNMPDANIAIELYSSFDPVCPDGFLFYANPPMGSIYVESYRTVTQVYEYMYAPVFMDGKFKYYDRPGFQFMPSYNTEASQRFAEFLKGWGTYLKNKPAKPLKSPVFVAEFPDEDDRFDFDFSERDANNISQAGQSYMYETMAEAGIPKGFSTTLEGILDLEASMTDICILPSLKNASDAVKQKIRALSQEGVALIAVSDVADLCDLFGVKSDKKSVKLAALQTNTEHESITRRDTEINYSADGAEVLLSVVTQDGQNYPFVCKYGNNILLNGYICHVGCAQYQHDFHGIANISQLLKKVMMQVTKEVASPLATADNNCGISVFETENGEKRILLTDFTLCGNTMPKQVMVQLNFDAEDVVNVCHKDMAVAPEIIRVDGKVKAFRVTLRPGESTMFKPKTVCEKIKDKKLMLVIFLVAVCLYLNLMFKMLAGLKLTSTQIYPLCQGLGIINSSVIGMVFFKEKINAKAIVGMAISIAALMLINL